MGFHTFDAERADRLEDAASRYRYLSREELLEALAPTEGDVLADLGSGTGFYTDDVAPCVREILAVDVQQVMHEYYREKGVPENVELLTGAIERLPFETDAFDGAFSTMTYHEFASRNALKELARVLAPGGRLVLADWSAEGEGEGGPPLEERFTASDAVSSFREVGFEIRREMSRPETFLIVAER